MIVKLPLTTSPAQRFSVYLNKKRTELYVKFNSRSKVWTMDLKDVASGTVLLNSIPLLLGQELLEPYNLGLGKMFLHDHEALHNVDATDSDLGDRVLVFWTDGDLS